MLDELAKRYGTPPDGLIADADTHPIEAAWFRLMLARLCARAGWANAKTQIGQLNTTPGAVQYVVQVPGS